MLDWKAEPFDVLKWKIGQFWEGQTLNWETLNLMDGYRRRHTARCRVHRCGGHTGEEGAGRGQASGRAAATLIMPCSGGEVAGVGQEVKCKLVFLCWPLPMLETLVHLNYRQTWLYRAWQLLLFPRSAGHWQPRVSQSRGTIFPPASAHSVSLCPIWVILTVLQSFSLLLYLLWWSVLRGPWCDYCDSLKAQMMVSIFQQ